LVETRFVMNLNLDDRLCCDAAELMETALMRNTEAIIVGGEWKVCYSQRETDEVDRSYSVDHLPYASHWPPLPGTRRRLGLREQGTLGPTTMWRMTAHVTIPRYPWRLPDGTVLQIGADSIWWWLLRNHLNRKPVLLPFIIGNYHSHPADQARFRYVPH